jgi:indoleamine 2,3-dioxygenase
MKEGCRPEYFWSSLRPLFNGWELIKTKQQEREETGVKLEGIEIADKRLTYSYRGPSGAQSSIIPALDAALGVKHDINNMYQTLLTFQQYMPNEHQSFINLLHTSSIKKVVKASQSNALHTAWKQAVDSLKLFRLAHLGLVSQYLYKPAARQGMAENQLIGTGGTPITDYLASRHESTQVRAKL